MKRLLYTLLAVSIIFSACEKGGCKTCGVWYTIDDNLTQAEQLVILEAGLDQLMQLSEDQNREYCGDELDLQEQVIDNMGSSASTQMQGYTATSECR